jgi:hypothetical protein
MNTREQPQLSRLHSFRNWRTAFAGLLVAALNAPVPDSAFALETRDRLKVAEFFEKPGDGPVDNRFFLPVGESNQALHSFEGELVIPEFQDRKAGTFPAVSVKFFSNGNELLPASQDIVISPTSRTRWSFIFSPGRVWSEPGDKGFSRASFPFVLAGKTRSAAHNGIATFLFDDKSVSPLIFQIVQESPPNDRFDSWGKLPISFTRHPIENREALVDARRRELAARIPTRPLKELPVQFGPEGALTLKKWPETKPRPAETMDATVAGLLVDGELYVSRCRTRYGPYPFCSEMRHGVYSVSKSLGATLAMLRLAQKYGDAVFDLKIKDFVGVTAEHDGWSEVTFGDALNMATGIGDAPVESTMVFESIPPYHYFSGQLASTQKLATAFTSANYPWGPGEVFRYRDMDTFILAAAMDGYLKSREGGHANIWDMVVNEILTPIGVMNAPMIHTIEPDGARGIPIFPEGYFPTYQEIAKISQLFQNGGRHDGDQLLNRTMLAEALYRTDVRGLPFPTGVARFAGFTYHMGLWHRPIDLGDCEINVSKMAGWGGNSVLLLPTGGIAFTLRNRGIDVDSKLATAVHAIDPQCQ